jgi:hypothetical protein
MKSWFLAIVWPDLPHSPSMKLPWSREVRFNKVVTKLLGLSSPIKAPHVVSIILNLFIGVKAALSLIDTRGDYHLVALE